MTEYQLGDKVRVVKNSLSHIPVFAGPGSQVFVGREGVISEIGEMVCVDFPTIKDVPFERDELEKIEQS